MNQQELYSAYDNALAIQQYLKNNKLLLYNAGGKIHEKQIAFHKDTHRNRWLFGGNRTGKTVAGAVETVWYARGNHPYKQITRPMRGWVVSLTNEVQRDVAQKEILRWLNPTWITKIVTRKGRADDPQSATIDFICVRHISGGESIIGFKSCDQGREKFQGTSLNFIWFDEEPPEEIYNECKMRIIDTQGDMWGTMTPLKGLTWVYDTIYINERRDESIRYWFMNWNDNPYLSPTEIKQLESTLSKEELEARKFGKFVAMSGLVYKEFNEDVHVIPPFDIPDSWKDTVSIDPGYTHPLSCHFYACDPDGNVYVVAEHYQTEMTADRHAAEILAIAKENGWPLTETGYLSAIIDTAATQRTAASEKSVVDLFLEHGIICDPRVNKSKYAGIQRVKEYLHPREGIDGKSHPKLFIFENCVSMIKEFKTYRWAKNGKDEPEKENDHAMDELRYYIMRGPVNHDRPEAPKYHFEVEKPELENYGITDIELTDEFFTF